MCCYVPLCFLPFRRQVGGWVGGGVEVAAFELVRPFVVLLLLVWVVMVEKRRRRRTHMHWLTTHHSSSSGHHMTVPMLLRFPKRCFHFLLLVVVVEGIRRRTSMHEKFLCPGLSSPRCRLNHMRRRRGRRGHPPMTHHSPPFHPFPQGRSDAPCVRTGVGRTAGHLCMGWGGRVGGWMGGFDA